MAARSPQLNFVLAWKSCNVHEMLINKILLKNTKNHKLRISAVAALLALGPMTVMADQVINDDLIVVGNACIGFDCSEDMVFNTVPLVLQENNTRLTLGGAGEFRLAANENTNGGVNEFRIDSFESSARSNIGVSSVGGFVSLPSAVELVDGSLQVSLDEGGGNWFSTAEGVTDEGVTDAVITFASGQVGTIPAGAWSTPFTGFYEIDASTVVTNSAPGATGFEATVSGMDRYVAFSGDDNMVVLGAGSEYQSGAVSVGSTSLQRSVKEVGDAVAVDDLINLSQLQGTIGSPILDLEAPIQTEFTRLNSVSAMTAAMSALQMNPRAQGPMSLSVGVGAYEGETAAAVGLQWRATDRVHFQVGFAASNATSAQTSLSIKMHW